MNKGIILALAALTATSGYAEDTAATNTPPTETNAPALPTTISVQEMLVSGPTQLKLHSLAMMTQGNVKGEIDESYLPGLKVCAEDPALPLRSVAAQLLGQHFVEGKKTPNPEALALLIKLANDESDYVSYNAVYYGLSNIQDKSDEIISLLIDIASKATEPGLIERIADSLKPDQTRVIEILNQKLQSSDNIAFFEIYEDLAGKVAPNAEKYLSMPSSRPHLFIFNGDGGKDAESFKSALVKAIKDAGVENPNVSIAGEGENYTVFVKTYITKDYLAVKRAFSNDSEYKISQDMWLTPELEIQVNSLQNK